MRTYETITETAKRLRADYKARGWTARDISVRASSSSLSASLRVEVRSARVDAAAAREMAEGCEDIRRCEITHEILGGGNRFVHFEVAEAVREDVGLPFRPIVEAAFAEIAAGADAARVAEGTYVMTDGIGWLSIRQIGGARSRYLSKDATGIREAAYFLATLPAAEATATEAPETLIARR